MGASLLVADELFGGHIFAPVPVILRGETGVTDSLRAAEKYFTDKDVYNKNYSS